MARILIVDDSPTQLVLLRGLLQDEPHELLTAEDGKVAFEMITQDPPDLVVTDMQMPNMNGLELIKQLRRSMPQVPSILITARGSEELAVEALRVGAAAYLPKSKVHEELIGNIEHVLDLLETDYSYANLIDRLDYHEFQFTLENDPNAIGPLVNLMQQMSAGVQLLDDVTRSRIGMAVEQALHNAIFRGNLDISRTEQQADEEFEIENEQSLVERRRKESPYASRQVVFRARLAKHSLEFMIHDEGQGFDTTKLPSIQDPKVLDVDGGRGLVLIRSFMDTVRFNEKGNEITMIKQTRPLYDA